MYNCNNMNNKNKTQENTNSVNDFLAGVNSERQQESKILIDMMRDISGNPPVMWGSSIIGFGKYHYKYKSGREGDWMKIGFSPRKAAISLYLSCDADQFTDELSRLGKHSRGVGCIYIKHLDDVNLEALSTMVKKAYSQTNDVAVD